MKQFYCAEDIERLVARGENALVLGEDAVLTDLARQRAQDLGLSLMRSPQNAAPTRPAGPSDELFGKPKGCQHGPLPDAPSQQSWSPQASDPVVDELVGLVKRLRDET